MFHKSIWSLLNIFPGTLLGNIEAFLLPDICCPLGLNKYCPSWINDVTNKVEPVSFVPIYIVWIHFHIRCSCKKSINDWILVKDVQVIQAANLTKVKMPNVQIKIGNCLQNDSFLTSAWMSLVHSSYSVGHLSRNSAPNFYIIQSNAVAVILVIWRFTSLQFAALSYASILKQIVVQTRRWIPGLLVASFETLKGLSSLTES